MIKILKQFKTPIFIYLGGVACFASYMLISYNVQVVEYPNTILDWIMIIPFAYAWLQIVFVGYLLILAVLALKKYLNEQ